VRDKPRPLYAVTWEDASKNSYNSCKSVAELVADARTLLVTSVGHLTVKDKRWVVLSQQADHPADDSELWTYRDHIKIPRGMVRRMRRLS
jgi:hypothetical protein